MDPTKHFLAMPKLFTVKIFSRKSQTLYRKSQNPRFVASLKYFLAKSTMIQIWRKPNGYWFVASLHSHLSQVFTVIYRKSDPVLSQVFSRFIASLILILHKSILFKKIQVSQSLLGTIRPVETNFLNCNIIT